MELLAVVASLLIFAIPALILIGYGGWLSVHDIRTHRLPNKHVALLTACVFICESLICLFTGEWNPWLNSLKTSAFIATFYLALFIISRRQLGMGDVKYAVPTGLVLGFYNPHAWLMCIFVTFSLAGLVAVLGMLSGRLTRSSRIAFGPYMTVATLILIAIQGVNSP